MEIIKRFPKDLLVNVDKKELLEAFDRYDQSHNVQVIGEFVYHLPDAEEILNSLVLPLTDRLPNLPRLHNFVDWWNENLEGKLSGVHYDCRPLVEASDFRYYPIGNYLRVS